MTAAVASMPLPPYSSDYTRAEHGLKTLIRGPASGTVTPRRPSSPNFRKSGLDEES